MEGEAADREQVRTYRGRLAATEAAELAITHALLRLAAQGRHSGSLRVYSPTAPVVVFGRRDTRLAGFRAAVRAAERAGFDTAVRAVGGRVVAYTQNAVVLDVVRRDPQAVDNLDRRFIAYGEQLATALRALGVEAQLGAVPGEYCPGAHSVNARGIVKLVGTAQRVVKNAWLFSSLVIVDDADRLREVLTDVHRHLDLPFEASSVGSVRGENPALTLTDVEIAVAQVWDQGWRLRSDVPSALDAAFRELALTLEPSHSTAG
jgi:octanoyl-[GcvH]:protein N-octanoyltransferase